jgi:hypothetical protein
VVLAGPGILTGVRLALRVVARAARPYGDPHTQRLVTPYDCLDRLSADGTDVFVAVHVLRVGRRGRGRFTRPKDRSLVAAFMHDLMARDP